jgi:hypothetical protein
MPHLVPMRVSFGRRRVARPAGVPSVSAAVLPRPRRRHARRFFCLAGALSAGLVAAPAARAGVVTNYTFHVPASVQTNPCFPGDVVNLNGDIHIVITTTANAGGYQTHNHLNSLLSGKSITTGTGYVNSEDNSEDWIARAPFPMVHTHTYDFDLVSKSATANYMLHMTMHETVTAMGVPAAAVDNWRMDCQG